MGVYKLSIKSEFDIANMFEYGIETFGIIQAQKYFYGIHDVLQSLSENINLERDASEFLPSLKRFTYKSHTIFYLDTTIGILVIRVLSQSMDYNKNL